MPKKKATKGGGDWENDVEDIEAELTKEAEPIKEAPPVLETVDDIDGMWSDDDNKKKKAQKGKKTTTPCY